MKSKNVSQKIICLNRKASFNYYFKELYEAGIVLKGSEINTAKQILATEVTTLAHGRDRAKNAEETSKTVFADGSSAKGLPTEYFSESELINGVTGAQLFTKSGLSSSGKDAKRLISDGGARIDGIALNDNSKLFYIDDIINGLKLSAGKKRHALIKIKK